MSKLLQQELEMYLVIDSYGASAEMYANEIFELIRTADYIKALSSDVTLVVIGEYHYFIRSEPSF